MKFFLFTALFLSLSLCCLYSIMPNTISWQGIIQDGNGNNLNGSYNITVKLYDVAINGTVIWTETHNAVQILDGITNISLGSITSFNLSFDKQYWLEITVGNGTPLPRIKLQSVPYSFHSLVADSLASDIMENDPTWSGSNDTTGSIYRYGNVAIGTSSPKAQLHIYGDETGTGNVLFGGSWKLSNPGMAPDSGIGTRMMWYPDKAAFRSGYVANKQWNSDNIGYFSTAFGTNTTASGFNTTAIGSNTSANGNFSFAGGESSEASGEVSVALGDGNKASGDFSIAFGEATTASGLYSTSMGKGTIASGYNASSFGRVTTASGDFSTTFGENTFAESAYETTFGRWNTNYSPANTSGWNTSDRLLVVGNGTTSNSRSNALTILKNGKIGIGTDLPLALLHTKGMGSGEGNVLFTGSIKTAGQGLAPDSGAGTRMMWYPDKSAFRVGSVNGSQWNTSNVGMISIAMGNSTTASGQYSTAMGNETYATGFASTAIGANTSAKSAYETVIGRWNTDYTPSNSTVWNSTDRLFVIGNGTDDQSRSNALTILKSGKIGIGTDSPFALIHAKGLNTGEGNVLFTGEYKTSNPGLAPDSGAGTRLMWYPDKSAFRVGTVNGNQWNTINVGRFSIAMGGNNLASGMSSTAFGESTTASGIVSTAMGYNTTASGYISTAMGESTTASGTASAAFGVQTTASGDVSISSGFNTVASGYLSFAMGDSTIASGNTSTAMGKSTIASGDISTAMGYNTSSIGQASTALGYSTRASGTASTALGYSTKAYGPNSTAMGSRTVASGDISTAMGYNSTASGAFSSVLGFNSTASGGYSIAFGLHTAAISFIETVIGSFNTDYTPNSTSDWYAEDRLFVVGNGSGSNSRSNALTILKNGRIGLQTVTNPTFALELPNSATDGIGKGRANAWTTYSDGRIKTERKAIIYGLKEIMMLNPLSYYQHNSDFKNGKLEISDKGAYSFGFIAQDLFKIIPEIVSRPENENIGLWSLSYEKLTPVLVKAIQEQQEIIDNQKKKNDSQDMLIQIQNQKIEELEKKLEEIMRSIQSNK